MTTKRKLPWPASKGFSLVTGEDLKANPPVELPADAAWLAFDIETVRDPAFPTDELVPKSPGSAEMVPRFPSPPECEVVSIAAVAVAHDGAFQMPIVFGRGRGEERKLWEFARCIEETYAEGSGRAPVSVVSWNGRRFDAPVVAARLFKHGWPCPFEEQDYGYRFAKPGAGIHFDLCDRLANFGAGTMAKLDVFARLMGLPGKMGTDGKDVAGMHAAGLHDEIDFYCLTDAVQTAFLLGRHLVLRGQLTRKEYQTIVKRNYELASCVFAGHEKRIDEASLFLTKKGGK